MKKWGGKRSIEKKNVEEKGEGWSVEYLVVGNEINTAFIVILKVWGREAISWKNAICTFHNSWDL